MSLPKITYRTPLQWSPEDGTALPDDTIVTFSLEGNTIEVRHQGGYLEVCSTVRTSFASMIIEPRAGNVIWIGLPSAR